MNKHFLKNIRDNMPESLKYYTTNLFRNILIKNKEFCRYSKMLNDRALWDSETIKEFQFKELKEILIYSYQYVPYYSKVFDQVGFSPYLMKTVEDICVIPFLTKEIIRKNFDQLISKQKVNGGYYEATTGGSTGEPLKVLLDYDSVFKENAFINHFRSKLGYQLEDRLVTFRGIEFGNKLWKFNPMQNELIFSPFKLSKTTITTYVEKINEFKPNYLNGYLSSLSYFARLLSTNNLKLKHPLKGIFLISENINEEQRMFLENIFQVKTLTFYGHSERCIIGEEIKTNEYVFDPFYGYVELIKNEDASFLITGTGFLNKTMPLIRYKTDDICFPQGERLAIVGNRKSTMGLYGSNDEFFAHAAFNIHSEIFRNVLNYQFVQTKKGTCDLLIIVNKNFKLSEIKLMKKEIDKKAKGVIEFNIKITDQLILSKRGKFKMFISEIQA